MKRQLHFLVVASMLFTANFIFSQAGIMENFASFGDWAVVNKPEVSDGSGGTIPAGNFIINSGNLEVSMGSQNNPFTGNYRADLQFIASTNYTINYTADKIFAIKFIGDRPDGSVNGFKLELHNATDNNWINKGGARYARTGSVLTTSGDNIYYFDFSTDPNYVDGDLEIDKINLIVADVTGSPNYTVDWIATFLDVAALEAYKDTEDDTALGVEDFKVNNTFKMFPNPSGNEVSIEINQVYVKENSSVKIYNILGGLVYDKPVNYKERILKINHNLKSGIYLVKVGKQTGKLLVK